jgi:hypothetical protein
MGKLMMKLITCHFHKSSYIKLFVLMLVLPYSIFMAGLPTGQQKMPSVVQNILRFNHYFPREKVYLHFDNTGYFMGDTVWFKAYVMQTDNGGLSDLSHVLYVELVTQGGEVIKTQKYRLEDGQTDGCICLDDKILGDGYYEVRAYTRYMTNWDTGTFSRVFPVFGKPRKEGDYSMRKLTEYRERYRLPDNREAADTVDVKKINVHFYPEGGHLVQGLPCTVAYAVTDGTGCAVSTHGWLVAGRDTLSEVSTSYEGRGRFTYTPGTETARLMLSDGRGHVKPFVLPAAESSGCVLTVDALQTSRVTFDVNATADYQGKPLCWVLTHEGSVEAYDILKVTADGCAEAISRSAMSGGVNQLTLFDTSGNVVADRLIFNYPASDASDSIRMSTESDHLTPCGKIGLTARTLPATTFSLSVRDYAYEVNGSEGDARTWLLLTGDLKGYVSHPEHYFEADDAVHRMDADLLMMVQGWRCYDLAQMSGKKAFEKRQPIEDALYVDGQVRKAKKRSPSVGGVSLTATLYSKTGASMSGTTKTDSAGYYALRLPDCIGDWTMLMNTKLKDEDTQYNIAVNRHFSPSLRYLSGAELSPKPIGLPRLQLREPIGEEDEDAFNQKLPMTKRVHKIKEVKIRGRQHFEHPRDGWESQKSGAYYSKLYYDCAAAADEIEDRGELMPGLLEWLCIKNPLFSGESGKNMDTNNGVIERPLNNDMKKDDKGIKKNNNSNNKNKDKNDKDDEDDFGDEIGTEHATSIRNKDNVVGNNFQLDRCISSDGLMYKNRPIVWIVDNEFHSITGYQYVFYLDDVANEVNVSIEDFPEILSDAKAVYISEDRNAFMHYIYNPDLIGASPVTIFVYTFHSFFYKKKGNRRTHFSGFEKPETFDMTDYSVLPPAQDFRRTLYWNPNVKTSKDGAAKVEFYNNSSCRHLMISAEGITKDGKALVY